MPRLRLFEIFLIQFLVYLVLWLWDDYIASLLSIIMIFITAAILIVALIAELIEKSKVPRSYFIFMLGSILIPVLVGLIFIALTVMMIMTLAIALFALAGGSTLAASDVLAARSIKNRANATVVNNSRVDGVTQRTGLFGSFLFGEIKTDDLLYLYT